ncbi:hypothetical protein ACA910_008959 [Epithemia clementina (nom. ined.)]
MSECTAVHLSPCIVLIVVASLLLLINKHVLPDSALFFCEGFAVTATNYRVVSFQVKYKESSYTKIATALGAVTMGDRPKPRFITNKMCPFAQKVWIALEKSKVPYKLEQISLYGSNGKPDWFWDLNPSGTVPVLVYYNDDNNEGNYSAVVVSDSDLILNHIEQGKVPGCQMLSVQSLTDKTTDQHQQVASLVHKWRQTFVNNQLIPMGKQAVFSSSMSPKLQKVLTEMDETVVGPYLSGNLFTTADCHVFPFVWRLHQEFKFSSSSYPNLVQWLEKCTKDEPAVRSTVQSAWWWWW